MKKESLNETIKQALNVAVEQSGLSIETIAAKLEQHPKFVKAVLRYGAANLHEISDIMTACGCELQIRVKELNNKIQWPNE